MSDTISLTTESTGLPVYETIHVTLSKVSISVSGIGVIGEHLKSIRISHLFVLSILHELLAILFL